MTVWNKFLRSINKLTEWTTMLFLVVMVVIVFWQIVSRVLFGSSFTWTSELAKFLMVWIIFLGAGFAFQYGAHISIEVVVDRVSIKVKKLFQILVLLFSSIFIIILILNGLELVGSAMEQISASLGIPMGYVYTVIPISGILILLNMIDVTIRFITTDNTSSGVDEI